MSTPAQPSQDEVMAEIFGITPEDYQASLRHRAAVMESFAYRIPDASVEDLKRWRALRPGLKTRT